MTMGSSCGQHCLWSPTLLGQLHGVKSYAVGTTSWCEVLSCWDNFMVWSHMLLGQLYSVKSYAVGTTSWCEVQCCWDNFMVWSPTLLGQLRGVKSYAVGTTLWCEVLCCWMRQHGWPVKTLVCPLRTFWDLRMQNFSCGMLPKLLGFPSIMKRKSWFNCSPMWKVYWEVTLNA